MRKQAKAPVQPIRQSTQYNCMTTSMAMCLRANGISPEESTTEMVNKVMGAQPMKGASWEQALACAQHYGMRAILMVPCTVKKLKEWTDQGIPVMIAWNPEGRDWSHASVVFDVQEGDDGLTVLVADPNIPNPDKTVRTVTDDDFYHKWFEKWPDYLVRRPAMAVMPEITLDGRQVMASSTRVAAIADMDFDLRGVIQAVLAHMEKDIPGYEPKVTERVDRNRGAPALSFIYPDPNTPGIPRGAEAAKSNRRFKSFRKRLGKFGLTAVGHSEDQYTDRSGNTVVLRIGGYGTGGGTPVRYAAKVMASNQIANRTSKVLDKLWIVADPKESSLLVDILWEVEADRLPELVIGSGAARWRAEHTALHTDPRTARQDALARLKKLYRGDIPSEVLRNSSVKKAVSWEHRQQMHDEYRNEQRNDRRRDKAWALEQRMVKKKTEDFRRARLHYYLAAELDNIRPLQQWLKKMAQNHRPDFKPMTLDPRLAKMPRGFKSPTWKVFVGKATPEEFDEMVDLKKKYPKIIGNDRNIEDYQARYVQKLFQDAGLDPSGKKIEDSGADQKVQILEALAEKVKGWPEGLEHVNNVLDAYRAKKRVSPEDLKKIRNFLYKNRMRDEANHFRKARDKETTMNSPRTTSRGAGRRPWHSPHMSPAEVREEKEFEREWGPAQSPRKPAEPKVRQTTKQKEELRRTALSASTKKDYSSYSVLEKLGREEDEIPESLAKKRDQLFNKYRAINKSQPRDLIKNFSWAGGFPAYFGNVRDKKHVAWVERFFLAWDENSPGKFSPENPRPTPLKPGEKPEIFFNPKQVAAVKKLLEMSPDNRFVQKMYDLISRNQMPQNYDGLRQNFYRKHMTEELKLFPKRKACRLAQTPAQEDALGELGWTDAQIEQMSHKRIEMVLKRKIRNRGRKAKVDEKLMIRAALLLIYKGEKAAAKILMDDGISAEDAFLAVKSGGMMNRQPDKLIDKVVSRYAQHKGFKI